LSVNPRALELRHLELARQELGALIDAIDSMGDLGRFLPDLQRIAAQMDADFETLRVELED
jgi:UTP:GlnB (protein PII) uridylyltransferase